MALPATDTFTGTTNTQLTTYNTSWTLCSGDFDIQTNQLSPDLATTEGGAGWNADAFNADQYALATFVQNSSGATSIGVAVRCNVSTPNDDYYGFYVDSGSGYMFKMVNGTWTQFGAATTRPANGSIIKIDANGTTITAYDDGATLRTATDSALASGAAGVSGYGDSTSPLLDNWEGGNLGGGGGGGTVVVFTRRSLMGVGA